MKTTAAPLNQTVGICVVITFCRFFLDWFTVCCPLIRSKETESFYFHGKEKWISHEGWCKIVTYTQNLGRPI